MSPKWKKWLRVLLVAGLFLGMCFLCLIHPTLHMHFAAERAKRSRNLKQLMFAIHDYHDNHKRLPFVAIRDKDGKSLLSWRVAILPFMEEGKLFEQFKLDEPWDSEHNITLLEKMPSVYCMPWQSTVEGMTHFQVFVGPGTPFERDGLTLKEITAADGASNTIFVVEARDAVPWTKPADLDYNPNKPLPAFYLNPDDLPWYSLRAWSRVERLFLVGLGDGSVHTFSYPLDEKRLHAMITWNGGEVIEW